MPIDNNTYPLSGSGVRLDSALEQGDAGSAFAGRVTVATVSSNAISIFGPASALTAVVFRTFDFFAAVC